MPTPLGFPTSEDLQNAQKDVEHLGRVVNSEDAQGNPITSSTNRTGGVNKTLDALQAEYQTAIQAAGGVPLGTWVAGVTYNAYNEYLVYNDIPYKPAASTPLPYTTQGSDPTVAPDAGNVVPFAEVTRSDLVTVREDLLGPGTQLYMGDDGDTVKVGDTVPMGTTHLRVEIGGSPALVAMSPVASGGVTALSGDSATIGGIVVTLVGSVEKFVSTMREMREMTVTPSRLYVSGYNEANDGSFGSNFYTWNPTSTEPDNGGTVIKLDSISTGRYELQYTGAKYPEFFGYHLGNTANENTDAIKRWWQSGGTLRAVGDYEINGTDSFVCETNGQDFVADLFSASFTVTEPRAYMFRVFVTDDGDSVYINGGRVVGQNNVARPIELKNINDAVADTLYTTNITITDVFGNNGLSFSSSVLGIRITCPANTVICDCNTVNGVNREYGNSGSVASRGIGITNLIGVLSVTHNTVSNVQSPDGEADADGISVFSRDRLIAGARQEVSGEIAYNKLSECKGRFVKSQSTGLDIHSNKLFSLVSPLYDNSFRAIDCQFGGCNVWNNDWYLKSDGANPFFSYTQVKTGTVERVTNVYDNRIHLGRDVGSPLFFVHMKGGDQTVSIKDNKVISDMSKLTRPLVRVSTEHPSEPLGGLDLTIKDNVYTSTWSTILWLYDAEFSSNPDVADYTYSIINNRNTYQSPDNSRLIQSAEGDKVPYLGKVQVSGNDCGNNRIDAKGLSVFNIASPSDFYFGIGGGSGGLLDTPSGYNRYCNINKTAISMDILKSGGSSFAKADLISSQVNWYEFTGSAI